MENQVTQPVWSSWDNNGRWSFPLSVEQWIEENPKFNLFLQYYKIREMFINICEYGLYYFELYDKFIDKPEILNKMFVFLNNIKDNNNQTPLSCACWNDNLEMVKLLLENGAQESINVEDNYNQTPLLCACYKNNLEMVKILLENGAKKSINVGDNNKTPLYWAKKHKNKKMIELLKKYPLLINNYIGISHSMKQESPPPLGGKECQKGVKMDFFSSMFKLERKK